MVVIDWTISIGNLLTAATLLIALFGWTIKLFHRFENIEARITTMSDDASEIRKELKAVGGILIQLAAFEQRILNFESNQTRIQKELDDIRHGEGFVLPIVGGRGK